MAARSTMTRPPAGSTWRGRMPLTRPTTQPPGNKIFGSGALSGKMLLVRIVEKNKIYAYFRAG